MKPSGENLEQYRARRGMTYEQLAAFIGAKTRGQSQDWAIGRIWPGPDALIRILRLTDGQVTVEAMYARRKEFRANGSKRET